MSKIEVAIANDNPFNEGWLRYLLGLDRPADDPEMADGWAMAQDTRSLRPVRQVFIGNSHYVIRVIPSLDSDVIPKRRSPKVTEDVT